jgi:predicted phosphodiesterase
MRILLVSDLHYGLASFDWVLDNAPNFDVVVLAGDHLDVSSLVPLESQIVVVRTYLRKMAELTTVIACSGNHDLTATNRSW